MERSTADNSRVDQAIADAIAFYQPRRFYFNETRTVTFSTVAGTDLYTFNTPTLTGTIGAEFYRIDEVLVLVGSTYDDVRRIDYDWLESLADNNTGRGQPYNYAYINRQMRLYPNPDAIYTVRILGHVKAAAPANDAEADNVWTNEGFELIRCRAKFNLATHVFSDDGMAGRMVAMERIALTALMGATYRKTEGGRLVPTQF